MNTFFFAVKHLVEVVIFHTINYIIVYNYELIKIFFYLGDQIYTAISCNNIGQEHNRLTVLKLLNGSVNKTFNFSHFSSVKSLFCCLCIRLYEINITFLFTIGHPGV